MPVGDRCRSLYRAESHRVCRKRVMTAVFKDDAELFKQFSDNESFHKWLTDTVFSMTYE